MADFFYVYVGALYTRNGLGAIQSWISRLMVPGGPEVPLPMTSAPPAFDGAHSPQMNQYMQQSYMQQAMHGVHRSPPTQPNQFSPPMPNSQLFATYTGTPPQPPNLPPPLPSTPSYNYNQQPSSTLSLVTLALVNQTAAQKGISVTYPADQEGPPHQPTWTVRCCSMFQSFRM